PRRVVDDPRAGQIAKAISVEVRPRDRGRLDVRIGGSLGDLQQQGGVLRRLQVAHADVQLAGRVVARQEARELGVDRAQPERMDVQDLVLGGGGRGIYLD